MNHCTNGPVDYTQSKGMLTTCDLQGANLLMNSDFSVWQRGGRDAHVVNYEYEEKYGPDRWCVTKYSSLTPYTFEMRYYGISMYSSASVEEMPEAQIRQYFEVFDFDNWYTVQVKLKRDDTVYTGTQYIALPPAGPVVSGTFFSDKNWSVGWSVNPLAEDYNFFRFEIRLRSHDYEAEPNPPYEPYDNLEIEWVKLEKGKVATAYVHPEPGAELAACRRYFFGGQDTQMIVHLSRFDTEVNGIALVEHPGLRIEPRLFNIDSYSESPWGHVQGYSMGLLMRQQTWTNDHTWLYLSSDGDFLLDEEPLRTRPGGISGRWGLDAEIYNFNQSAHEAFPSS